MDDGSRVTSNLPPDMPSEIFDTPSSEVGLPETLTTHNTGQITQNNSVNNDSDRWKLLFEMQQRQMMELIRAIKEPSLSNYNLSLPAFDPDSQDSDARAWCNTVDLCMQERQLTGSSLVIAMSKALKGAAATWLSQHSFSGITWPQLRDLFIARFDYVETPAATLCRLLNESPKEGECLSAYASRFLSTLMSQWRNLSTEQIAIAVTLAHATKIEPQLQRLAFTTDIGSRVKMQQELMAFSYRKRGPQDKSNAPNDSKRPKMETPSRRCYICDRVGHLASECRGKKILETSVNSRSQFSGTNTSVQSNNTNSTQQKKILPVVCYHCGEQGHIATHCQKKENSTSDSRVERRVNICTLKPASELLSTVTGGEEDTHEDV